ncbi:beta-lactamase class A [Desulfofundulus australicus DSM 11792]|uniref:Beta-lactamase class A n=2 Tax=Peptococcaceae TaxID=186807 RepID=A0A1M4YVG1_9FIRM|nr:beta-lactamase class A [Desulfofundulus australicus DSM 11792]
MCHSCQKFCLVLRAFLIYTFNKVKILYKMCPALAGSFFDSERKGVWWMNKRLIRVIIFLMALPFLVTGMAGTWNNPALCVSPALATEEIGPSFQQVPDYQPLQKQLKEYLARQPGVYGIYFKDLHSGVSFDINGDEPVTAASTVKVPVVLYLNHLVAQGKLDWDDRVVYDSKQDYQGGAGILQFAARDGDSYSLRVLANLSITISDNIAYRMLVRHLGKDNVAQFMRDLGGQTVFPGGENITTARDMGRYMEAVLEFSREHPALGERLLDDMAHPIYHVGLPGKLPPKVRVAHKEGDVWGVANDVGIVFAEHPYILVVLSRGETDVDKGFARIAEISRMVYDYQMNLKR